jgi:hypothetical protein
MGVFNRMISDVGRRATRSLQLAAAPPGLKAEQMPPSSFTLLLYGVTAPGL